MTAPRIALITPSYLPDLDRCRLLIRSADIALQGDVTHHLIVPSANLAAFRRIAGSNTLIHVQEDLLPAWIRPIDVEAGKYFSERTGELSGWRLQQLLKLAAFDGIDEDLALFLDSDNVFIRPVDLRRFLHGGRLVFRRSPTLLPDHIAWNQQAARVLHIDPDHVGPADYIGNFVGWRRENVESLRHVLAERNGTEWQHALMLGDVWSEYALYGVYVEHELGVEAAGHYSDDKLYSLPSWGVELCSRQAVDRFLANRASHQCAAMFHSKDDVPIWLYEDPCLRILRRNVRVEPLQPAVRFAAAARRTVRRRRRSLRRSRFGQWRLGSPIQLTSQPDDQTRRPRTTLHR